MQRIAEQNEPAWRRFGGEHAGHSAAKGMTADDRRAEVHDLCSIGTDGSLGLTYWQADGLGVEPALAEPGYVRAHARRGPRCAVSEIDHLFPAFQRFHE